MNILILLFYFKLISVEGNEQDKTASTAKGQGQQGSTENPITEKQTKEKIETKITELTNELAAIENKKIEEDEKVKSAQSELEKKQADKKTAENALTEDEKKQPENDRSEPTKAKFKAVTELSASIAEIEKQLETAKANFTTQKKESKTAKTEEIENLQNQLQELSKKSEQTNTGSQDNKQEIKVTESEKKEEAKDKEQEETKEVKKSNRNISIAISFIGIVAFVSLMYITLFSDYVYFFNKTKQYKMITAGSAFVVFMIILFSSWYFI